MFLLAEVVTEFKILCKELLSDAIGSILIEISLYLFILHDKKNTKHLNFNLY